jgi:hypothetical protein
MKTYGVWNHRWIGSPSSRLTQEKATPESHCRGGWMGSSDGLGKILYLPGIEPLSIPY